MLMKLSTIALALLAATASKACVSALDGWAALGDGQFQSCNSGDFLWGIYNVDDGNNYYCAPYPGQPVMESSSAAASASLASTASNSGRDGWICSPPGQMECPAGYAMSEICLSNIGDSSPLCAEHCLEPEYFAIKCVPTPIANVPLNTGEWQPTGPDNVPGHSTCSWGSVLCGFCASNNPNDCQGSLLRGKCCKYPSFCFIVTRLIQKQFRPTAHVGFFLLTRSH
jgi:hypothetical protein